ncbi:hypothetical protein J1N35_006867 [Gossypium stocksii]|uniref:HAT C-terminal dimerisation domain-containing protein n=1 Tax=Gossypium stocksii TaxID=47602 RepID=A0A9D4AEP8_9ROSI|nr:hypothetical protein J1N35_006867 [Gossypium stocksii]
MSLVLTTKDLIQKLRDDGWNELLKNVISFCETWELDFPDMNAQYIMGCSRNKKEDVTVEHHYRVDIFFATIDTQLQELKSRFNKNVVELLTLTIALDPKEFLKLFDIDKIRILVNKFYPEDFSQQEKERLPYELKHYELDVCKHPNLRKISTLFELCRSLVESGKSVMYPLVDRLIRLILTLPVSTVSSERAFSVMKIVKTRLRNKMEDDFLSSLVVYIEKEIAEKFDVNEIIDDFSEVKDRRLWLGHLPPINHLHQPLPRLLPLQSRHLLLPRLPLPSLLPTEEHPNHLLLEPQKSFSSSSSPRHSKSDSPETKEGSSFDAESVEDISSPPSPNVTDKVLSLLHALKSKGDAIDSESPNSNNDSPAPAPFNSDATKAIIGIVNIVGVTGFFLF